MLTPSNEHLRRSRWSECRHETEPIQFATEIKVRAERKCGELLAQDKENNGAQGLGFKHHEVAVHDHTRPWSAESNADLCSAMVSGAGATSRRQRELL